MWWQWRIGRRLPSRIVALNNHARIKMQLTYGMQIGKWTQGMGYKWDLRAVLEVLGPLKKGDYLALSDQVPSSLEELEAYEEAPEELKACQSERG